MRINKRVVLLSLMTLAVTMPTFGQRFTKKEQALREARAANYFYGHSFTLSAGYIHGWLAQDRFVSSTYGRTGSYEGDRESYAFSFAWDYSKSLHHGFRLSAAYGQFGGSKFFYEDQGLGYGKQLRADLTETVHLNEVMVFGTYRYFIPLQYKTRLSLDAGLYLSRIVGNYSDAQDWDMGVAVGLGADIDKVSCSLTYLPGIFGNVVDGSTTRVSALMFSVGFHFWK